jgi:very-short-patch-repair endonuclease
MRDDETKSRMHAKNMRRQMTRTELLLWLRLRDANSYKFRRQHPIGPFIADFVHIRDRLVVEIDGDTHGTQSEMARDRRRDAYLRARGWTIERFTNSAIYENLDGAVEQILRSATPLTRPLLRSGRPLP